MPRLHLHPERHLVSRIGWLRAAVLGANDGIVSTASLIVGVAAAAATQSDILIVDLSRFCAAPLITYCAAKGMNHGHRQDG